MSEKSETAKILDEIDRLGGSVDLVVTTREWVELKEENADLRADLRAELARAMARIAELDKALAYQAPIVREARVFGLVATPTPADAAPRQPTDADLAMLAARNGVIQAAKVWRVHCPAQHPAQAQALLYAVDALLAAEKGNPLA